MCLQDLRITQGLTIRRIDLTTGADGTVPLDAMRRMLLLFMQSSDNVAGLFFVRPDGNLKPVPSDTRFSVADTSYPVYTRESMGPFLYTPCLVKSAAATATVWVWVYEYDSSVDETVNTLFMGR